MKFKYQDSQELETSRHSSKSSEKGVLKEVKLSRRKYDGGIRVYQCPMQFCPKQFKNWALIFNHVRYLH